MSPNTLLYALLPENIGILNVNILRHRSMVTTNVNKSRQLHTIQDNSVNTRLFMERYVNVKLHVNSRVSTAGAGDTSVNGHLLIQVKRRDHTHLNRRLVSIVVLTVRRARPFRQQAVSRVTSKNTRRHMVSHVTYLDTSHRRAVIHSKLRMVNSRRKRTKAKGVGSLVLVTRRSVPALGASTSDRRRHGGNAARSGRQIGANLHNLLTKQEVRQARPLSNATNRRASANRRARSRRRRTKLNKAHRRTVDVS